MHGIDVQEFLSTIPRTKSLKELGTLVDDHAKNWCSEGVLFAQIKIDPAKNTNEKVDVVSSSFNKHRLQHVLDEQISQLITNAVNPNGRYVPKVWSKKSGAWENVKTFNPSQPDNIEVDRPEIPMLAVHSRLSSNQFGLIALSKPEFNSNNELAIFHGLSLRLLDQLASLQNIQKTSILSRSERNCLVWGACGKTSGEIAQILSLSEHTVNHYFTLAAAKLGASNRTHATAKAIKLGIVSFDEIN